MMIQPFPPMDFSVDMRLEMEANNNCDICNQKVSEIMHSITALYSSNLVGENNTIKLEIRANPNLIIGINEKYGDHGKIINLHMEGGPITPQPGEGVYYNAPLNYPYPSPYAMQPQFLAGNYGYAMPNLPPPQKEAPKGVNKQHTAPPSYAMQPPPPMPLSSYSYIEPPFWPTAPSSGGKCVIM